MLEKFRGTGTAIVTPFHKDGNVDFKSFQNLIEFQIGNKVEYIVFLGTTGESVTLNNDERCAIINFAVEMVDKRVPVVVGIGGNNTQEIENTIRQTSFDGIDAVLSVSPYYNRPQQRGIYYHYKTLAAICPVPIIMYNVPSRTGSNITADTCLQIANDVPGVIGIKEASQNLSQCSKIIKYKPDNFLVISGNDDLALPFMAIGGDGVISVISNAFPKEFSQMIRYCLSNDFVSARQIHFMLVDIIEAIYADGSPSGIKAALNMKGLCQNALRLPLVKINKALSNQISTILNEMNTFAYTSVKP
jgi:4-hydroxy-tetrahydrodipicolinate synthase